MSHVMTDRVDFYGSAWSVGIVGEGSLVHTTETQFHPGNKVRFLEDLSFMMKRGEGGSRRNSNSPFLEVVRRSLSPYPSWQNPPILTSVT